MSLLTRTVPDRKAALSEMAYNTKSSRVIQLLLQCYNSDQAKHFISSVMDYATRCCTLSIEEINNIGEEMANKRALQNVDLTTMVE